MSYAHWDASPNAEPYRVTVIVKHIEYNSDADYLEDFTSGADLVLGWRAQLSGHDDATGVGTFARDNLDLDGGGIIPVGITIMDHFECTPLGDLRIYAWGVESDQENTLDTNEIMRRVVQNGDISTGPLEAQQDFEEADDEWIGFDNRNLRGSDAEGFSFDADVVLILDEDETIGVKMQVLRNSVEDTGQCEPSDSSQAKLIPDWFKTNAKWWKDGLISEAEIVNALESLMIQDVIPLDEFVKDSAGIEHQAGVPKGGTFYIPSYQKDVFGFWSEGLVSDQEIVNSVGFLIGQGIIDSQKIREKRASFAEISGLEIESPPIDYRTGSEDITVTKMPGIKKYADITLKRGTVSAINEAQQWNKLASEMLFKLKDGEEKIHKKNYEDTLLLYSESKTLEHLNQMLEQKEKSENAKNDALLAVENYKKIKELSEIAEDEYFQLEQDIPLELDYDSAKPITNESEYLEALKKIEEYAENAVRKAKEAVIQLKQQSDEEYPRTHPDFIWEPAFSKGHFETGDTGIKWSDTQLLLEQTHHEDSTVKIKVPSLIEQLFDPSIVQTHSMISQLDENPFISSESDTTKYYQYPENIARILPALLTLDPDETSRFWLPTPYQTNVFLSNPSIQVEIFDSSGSNISDFVEILSDHTHQKLFLPDDHEIFFLSFSNTGSDSITFETAIEYSEIISDPELAMTTIDSPLMEFGTDNSIFDVPSGLDSLYDSFGDFSSTEFDYEPEMSLMDYLKNEQLFFSECLLPPAGSTLGGPTPPENSRHNANYCGMSAFIHSMETTFPGALSHDTRTNPAQWDRLGDNLDHSNTFGERGGKFVENVNKNFGSKVITGNGKKYCAAEIEDTTPANLEAWNDICNIKMLIYDIPSFGHWVDITSISGNKITYQDYSHNHPATFDGKVVDFSNSNLGGPTKDHFRGNNPKAGDGFFESVQFYAVCECDKNSSSKMPTKNSKGQTLKLE